MFKVLLICTESALIVPVRETFPWDHYDCRLIGGTADADEGYQLFKLLSPDIVITDAGVMSKSNYTLIKRLSGEKEQTEFIIIADQLEFSCIRKCLQMGAESFIVKPVTAADLRRKLTAAVDELRRAKTQSRESKTLKFWSSRDTAQNDSEYIRMLLAGERLDPERLRNGNEYLNLTFLNGGYSVIALRFDRRAVMLKNRFREDELMERIAWIMDDVTESKIAYSLCMDTSDILYILLNYNSKSDYNMQANQKLAEQTAKRLSEEWETEVTNGVGFYCRRYEMIPFSKDEAVRNLERSKMSGTMRDILKYIDANLTSPSLSNEEIAKANFLNYSYLCTKFKQEMSVSVNRYITQLRLSKAVELLEGGVAMVPELASRVGFTDVKYFTKCFRDEYGLTPGQYIRKNPDEQSSIYE